MTRLRSEEIERKYWNIGDVATKLGVAQSNVRFWCQQFDITPVRHRFYRKFTPEDVKLLERIKELSDTGLFTLRGIKAKLSEEKEGEDFGTWLLTK